MNDLTSNTRIWFQAQLGALRLWLLTHWLAFKDTFYLVFFGADTVTIRIILAWASLISAGALFFDGDKFQLPAYEVVSRFGSEQAWAFYFFVHFVGVHWRIFERSKSRPKWALAINTWGFSVWFVSTVGVVWSVGTLGIPTSIAATMCAASAWSLFRTGLGRDMVTL